MPRTRFIRGPAGVGKTSYAIDHIHRLLDDGAHPETVLVLVPQRTVAQPYYVAFAGPEWPEGAQIDVATLGGLARRGLETFWPLVAEKAGFAQPSREPTFLTIETSQYFMAGYVFEAIKTGVFDSVSLSPAAIMRQTLDNLSKAAVNRLSLDDVADRLIAAWGGRHSSRPPVYRASVDVARRFRERCLQDNLLDFSLQIELFMDFLLAEDLYAEFFRDRYRHVVADNLEENFPVVSDFIDWMWDDLDSALLLYDTDAGYRIFLGADPAGMAQLAERCNEVEDWSEPVGVPPVMTALAAEVAGLFDADTHTADPDANPRSGFTLTTNKFFPQMIDWVVDEITALIDGGVSPREIVVLAPLLGDSLRFALTARLAERGIETVSHRPSRAVRDEPASRAMLTLTALAHPAWPYQPPVTDVADALHQAIDSLDPVRAWLLAQIVYRPGRAELGSFDTIRPDMQQRITYRAGEHYERLRAWLESYREDVSGTIPPDHFLSRLFGELVSQPGFGFHADMNAGSVVAELAESARKFRQALYPRGVDDWSGVLQNYFELVREGLLAALYVASWRDEERDAVFIAPAYTFLMRNRWVDYQFWLDAGSSQWGERLEQPLTHPYVLARSYPPNQIWTDDLEYEARRDALRRLLLGLVRRSRQQVFVTIANLGEQGYEQRGPLLRLVQQIIQRHTTPEGKEA